MFKPSSSASHHTVHKEFIPILFIAPSYGDERKSHINFARSINSNFPLCSFEHGNYDEENWDCEYVCWQNGLKSTVKEVRYNGIKWAFNENVSYFFAHNKKFLWTTHNFYSIRFDFMLHLTSEISFLMMANCWKFPFNSNILVFPNFTSISILQYENKSFASN